MSSEAYLEDDAVDEWSERCKRRRTAVAVSPPAAVAEDFQQLVLQEFLCSNSLGDSFDDLDFVFSGPKTFNFSNPMKQFNSEERETEQKAAIKAQRVEEEEEEEEIEEKSTRKKKKKEKEKVAYPFAVLKPTELEGDLTLAEINKRILRRPMRPVKHPVGEFACLPWVPEGGGGVGLSGKVVVGLTRIQTKGRGSITVIRTRG
ncbi:hypothetical protein KFK09_001168 [Dendrobium nobile]|uniref:Protein XRI1 n=1 Tax=Dendrobium nobile TaxID=94219 RepID=A0A8T3C428_DENNO|nr:hypothetical protein KFK09_001168 [Dendrobium nobile]